MSRIDELNNQEFINELCKKLRKLHIDAYGDDSGFCWNCVEATTEKVLEKCKEIYDSDIEKAKIDQYHYTKQETLNQVEEMLEPIMDKIGYEFKINMKNLTRLSPEQRDILSRQFSLVSNELKDMLREELKNQSPKEQGAVKEGIRPESMAGTAPADILCKNCGNSFFKHYGFSARCSMAINTPKFEPEEMEK